MRRHPNKEVRASFCDCDPAVTRLSDIIQLTASLSTPLVYYLPGRSVAFYQFRVTNSCRCRSRSMTFICSQLNLKLPLFKMLCRNTSPIPDLAAKRIAVCSRFTILLGRKLTALSVSELASHWARSYEFFYQLDLQVMLGSTSNTCCSIPLFQSPFVESCRTFYGSLLTRFFLSTYHPLSSYLLSVILLFTPLSILLSSCLSVLERLLLYFFRNLQRNLRIRQAPQFYAIKARI